MSNPPRLPDTFGRLAWSNLAAQSAEQIALAAAPIVAVLTLGIATVAFTSARLLVVGASLRQPAASRVRSGERASIGREYRSRALLQLICNCI